MALYLKDLKSLIENPMVQEKYLTSDEDDQELFLELDGVIYELNNLFYKDGHLVIRGDLTKLGETDKVDLSH